MGVKNTIEDLTQICIELRRCIETTDDDREKDKIVLKHIEKFAQKDDRVNDFAKGLEWFNVSEGLSVHKDLAGKIVILDFFTYCCINCMHILPDLSALEKTYSIEDGLIVVGVHSAKFENERDSTKIFSAIQRYNIMHPVVNDATLSMWQDIGIVCWPSLVILGPQGQPLFVLVGEGHRDELFLYAKTALKYFKSLNQISNHKLNLKLAQHVLPTVKSNLCFPGKIHSFAIQCKEQLVISDSGNNRILIMDKSGKVKHVIGGPTAGFIDGDFDTARFNSPQGICVLDDCVFVADNENHAIRKINLTENIVSTVAGTGLQGGDYVGGKIGTEQPLSSPWDVAIYQHEQTNGSTPVLLIAIAGTHQIWALFLQDTVWWKKKLYRAGSSAAIVGNGREANRNNSYAHAASLAQPSGLAVAQEHKFVFFADSESSSIRKVHLVDGKVSAVCGADKNPDNLHCFGDVDGKQYIAKLQHPLGIAWNHLDKMLYIADTYNHKIKKVDVEGNCVTVCGGEKLSDNRIVRFFKLDKLLHAFRSYFYIESGEDEDLFQFDEPSGLAVSQDGCVLYIADTNNHCIKTVNINDVKNITVMRIELPSKDWNNSIQTYNFSTTISTDEAELGISFRPVFHGDIKLNSDAPQKWSLSSPTNDWQPLSQTGHLSTPISIKLSKNHQQIQMLVNLNIVACKTTECIPKKLLITYTVNRESNAPTNVSEIKQLDVK